MLNLSQQSQSDLQEGSSIRGSDSDIGEPDTDVVSETEEMDYNDNGRDATDKESAAPNTMFQMMNQIQSLIKMTVEKANQEKKNTSSQKCEYVF